jgi:hypothetical protein
MRTAIEVALIVLFVVLLALVSVRTRHWIARKVR